MCAVGLDDGSVQTLDRSGLPENWSSYPAPSDLGRIGDDWVRKLSRAVLEVPSAIVGIESNYLVDPDHEDARAMRFGSPQPFRFDSRLPKAPEG